MIWSICLLINTINHDVDIVNNSDFTKAYHAIKF